jgi:hypothetical protein
LKPDVFKKVNLLCPVNFENAIIQAKMIEEGMLKQRIDNHFSAFQSEFNAVLNI